ncbi:alpha/beta fold hydrolase [Rhodococcus sp. (in: high G+C Gram-positive bacteria)]|uniref:alpha/beta fold hydrolase n=1 Tax=Rhodococcus sp. TaxID=1831 RepID=UPI0038908F8F
MASLQAALLKRSARKNAERDGHAVLRLVGDGADTQFPLTYIRTGPRGGVPVLIVPGGPGLASVVPYQRLRRRAERDGLDVLMVEHRGVGLSRLDEHGNDLPSEGITIDKVVDDLAAVLDHAGVERAIVYGSSYGTYLAQGLGVRYPDRVAGMILDSPMLSVEEDIEAARAYRRGLFLEGTDRDLEPVSEAVRTALARGVPAEEISVVVQIAYEYAGPEILRQLLTQRSNGRSRSIWTKVATAGSAEIDGRGAPFYYEPDLVSRIAFRELGYGLPPDGELLDPQAMFVALAARHPHFVAEPFDFPSQISSFSWPTAVISGGRDLRTPRPIAEKIVDLVPNAVLVPITDMGHSALDSHQLAAVYVTKMMADNKSGSLVGMERYIAGLPHRGAANLMRRAITGAVLLGRSTAAVASRLPSRARS